MGVYNKYGIFMGSFDPVHLGHERFVKSLFGYVDTVVIVPAYQNPFKNESMPFQTRVDMLNLAFEKEIKEGSVIIDTIEKDISFESGLKSIVSWLSLKEIFRKYGNASVITTNETFNSMLSWSRPEFLKDYPYIVCDTGYFSEVLKQDVKDFFTNYVCEDISIDFSLQTLHSSQIRKGSDSFRKKHLNPKVYDYIKEHNMYVVPANWPYVITEGEHKGEVKYSGRFSCIRGFVYNDVLTDGKLKRYFLANKRGPGCPNYQGYWNIPCGFIENYENAQEAVSREIHEECGIKIGPEEFVLDSVETEPAFCNDGNITLRYRAKVENREGYIYDAPSGEENEVEEVKWISLDEIEDYKWAFNHREVLLKEKLSFEYLSAIKGFKNRELH